ncbi:Amino acid transporter transmembrane [Macrophomina phaseolina MS6]|uniref:Amino acid transporter transmembrane n=1 Tax=Macrophomina phaseolina (strain MS6) TaxID=1126212 RepID=K2S2D3_MACPH|nr:Amino acid transporter transmembrane [Macrophomina phaseolina MS6]
MAMSLATAAADDGAPRLSKEIRETTEPTDVQIEQAILHADFGYDPNIPFEEYLYYASWTREYEKTLSTKGRGMSSLLSVLGGKKQTVVVSDEPEPVAAPTAEAKAGDNTGSATAFGIISDYEWHHASRAARTATWGAVFYLITTDILGPFSVPWALTQLGYGPGVALYLVFAAMAAFSGVLLWWQFLGLDSDKYPVKNYGDLGFRIYGNWFRYIINILQSGQFFLGVSLLIVTNGQSLAQLSQGPHGKKALCFTACLIIFTIAGFLLGQIRTMQKFGYVANIAVWMNLFVIFMTMGIVANSEPNYQAVFASYEIPKGPIKTSAGAPAGLTFVDNINGLMQAVYSYGGATMFCELMAEMRRPWDFWKGLIVADIFIFLCYIIFGLVVYSQQGQFAYNPAYQGINPYTWQTVGNVFAIITGLIAACLYGNIGIKVLYTNVGRAVFKFPALESKKGKWIFVFVVPIYWAVAFVISAAVPQISYLGAFVGAAMILQFSYTFPPLLALGFNCMKDAMLPGEGFDPSTGRVVRNDEGWKRLLRGYRKQFWMNSFNVIYFLGSAVTAILGIYASIYSMHQQYEEAKIQPFSCKSPTG